MIFVILGTQDKSFIRLLEEIDKQVEKGNIKGKIIVQAGHTEYKSKNMKIFDLIPMKKFNKYIEDSDYIITHGGVGSILDAIKKDKRVIAVPRLKEYGEHENDHQKQIINKFSEEKYILGCNSVEELEKQLRKINSFKPKKYIGNNKKMIDIIDNYIENVSYNKRFEVLSYLIFGFLTTFVNVFTYFIAIQLFNINYMISNVIAWITCVIFAYFTNKKYVFDKSDNKCQFVKFILSRIATLIVETLLLILFVKTLLVNDMISKIIISIIVIILNYILSKLCVFK